MSSRDRSRSPEEDKHRDEKEKDRVKDKEREKEKGRDRDSERSSRSSRKDKESSRDKDKDRDEGSSSSSSSSSRSSRRRSRSRSRSRDRKRRSRSRSRSSRRSRRSRSRSRSRSRDRRSSRRSSRRSRSRSRTPPKSKFSVTALAQTVAAVQTINQQLGGAKPDPVLLQQLLASTAAANSAQSAAALNPQLTRQSRRLYIGNLPVGMGLNEKLLTDFFNTTAISFGITTPQPVLSVWISSEGTFCFVEFRSVIDATTCISLFQGLTLGNRALRIGRPADYKEPPPHLANYVVGLPPGTPAPAPVAAPLGLPAAMMGFGAMPGVAALPSAAVPAPAVPAATAASPAPAAAPAVTSKALMLTNMVEPEELDDDEEFSDILIDVREECEKYGKIVRVVIPRPPKEGVTSPADEGQADFGPRTSSGLGRIFVLYDSPAAVAAAIGVLNGRTFNEKRVEATPYDEEVLTHGVYEA